jgi:hypothetical protein
MVTTCPAAQNQKLIRGGDRGEAEDDDIGLAVWNADGNLLLSDGKGDALPLMPAGVAFTA